MILTPKLRQERDYWIARLSTEIGTSNLTLDYKRSKVYSAKRDSFEVRLPAEVSTKMMKMAGDSSFLLYTILMAALKICLYKYSGSETIVVGSPAHKSEGEVQPNALAIVDQIDEESSFRQFLMKVRETLSEAYLRQTYDMNDLVKHLGIETDNKCPLFDIALVLKEIHRDLPQLKNDITITFTRETGEISGIVDFNPQLFKRVTIERFTNQFVNLLTEAVSHSNRPISGLNNLTDAERELLLVKWNETQQDFPSDASLPRLFEEQVGRTPDAICVSFGKDQLTYRELNSRANQLARLLRELKVGPDVRVGMCFERSPEMMIALMGILKAGGAYVPLDPEYPEQRLRFMVEDAQAPVLLTQKRLIGRLPGFAGEIICLDSDREMISRQSEENLELNVSPDNLAYVLYTSGSTGRPKGVMMPHRPLVNLVFWQIRNSSISSGPRTTQLVSLNVDVSFQEIFSTWISGGTLVLLSEEVRRDALALWRLLASERIERLFSPFVFLQQLAQVASGDEPAPECLREIITSGEQLHVTPATIRLFRRLNNCSLHNEYGPTEGHVVSAYSMDGAPDHWPALPPIGRPIANARLYVLNRELEPVPIGAMGELYIGATPVVRGYLQRPELTAEKFIPDPFGPEPGARLYKTGDLARYLHDGNIEIIGRIDHQVKIRGFRVELGEIETALCGHTLVRVATVLAREDAPGEKRLVAYLVLNQPQSISGSELRRFLKERLPEFMVPHAFVMLDALPLTQSGKIDRRALPAPDGARPEMEKAFVAPRNRIEETLCEVWSAVLGIERVGINDNFFELGGDSILTIQVVAKANREGLGIVPRQLFQHQTIAELSTVVGTAQSVQAEQGEVTGQLPLTPIQHWFFEQNPPGPHHFNMSYLFELQQVLDPRVLERSVLALLAHHDALRLRFVHNGLGWQTHNAPNDQDVPFTRLDLSELPEALHSAAIQAAATHLQASLNLADGPIIRVTLFDPGAQQPARLLVIIHHLAVDGVSWRILLEDLQTVTEQLARGDKVDLPSKTTSFKEWASQLVQHAQTETIEQEKAYWLSQPWMNVAPLPVDYAAGANLESSSETISVTLGARETEALLREIPAAHRLQINEVLLTALGQTFTRWTGSSSLLVDVEGHGREDVIGNIDLSRTVGWFTSISPVLITPGNTRTPGDALRAVKEQLHQIPNHGFGFGLLRYLSEQTDTLEQFRALPKAEVSFNYLGQSDQLFTENSLWRLSREKLGYISSPQNNLSHLIYIAAIVFQGQLHVRFKYSRNCFRPEIIDALAQNFSAQLQALITYCQTGAVDSYVPSDFPLARITQNELERMVEQVEFAEGAQTKRIEDAYPLSPAQEGILFHSLYAPESGVYVVQMSCTLRKLNVDLVMRAWQTVSARHPALRTCFVWNNITRPLQVVTEPVEIPFNQEDWREVSIDEQRERFAAYLLADRSNGFKLSKTPLMRLALFQVADDKHHFVWSHHHLLMDGWSIFLVLKELFTVYEALVRDQQAELDAVLPYRDYIAWLQQRDLSEAENFWRESLKGFTTATPLLDGRPNSTSHEPGDEERQYGELRVLLSAAETAMVQSMARRNQLTLNTLVQGAWSLLLSHHSGEHDVVFGATASGRPGELTGVESMIGLFINVLPMRAQITPEDTLLSWLKQLQEKQFKVRRYESSPLVQVQRWSEVPRGRPMFESILSFENYPIDDSIQEYSRALEISDVSGCSRTNYPITLVVAPHAELSARIVYDSKRFDESAIRSLLNDLLTLLKNFPDHLDAQVSELQQLLGTNERTLRVAEQRHHERLNLRKLRSLKPTAVRLPQGDLVKMEWLNPGQALPLVVKPAIDDLNLIEWANNNRELLEAKLLEHGAILFRGFKVDSVKKFEKFAQTICPELFGEYGDLPREGVGGHVYRSTPYPPDKAILFHNESSHLHRWPLKILFYCVQAATEGGETPIVDCQQLFQRIAPDVRERLTKKKLMYVRNYSDGLDVGWQTFFRTTQRSVVEDYCRSAAIDFEWKPDNSLRTRQIRPAVTKHPTKGNEVFFNQLQLHHASCLEPSVRESFRSMFQDDELPRNVYYGDGSPIEDEVVHEILEAYRESAVSFLWQEGDILALDNMLTAHGRYPFAGSRKIVVAMGQMITDQDLARDGVA